MKWGNIFILETVFTLVILLLFGFIKLPKFMRRRRLSWRSPWGYFTDRVPKTDPGFVPDNDRDFLHNTNTAYGGMKGFGDYGVFTGFGEMGEF
jgi:hypothetical protein